MESQLHVPTDESSSSWTDEKHLHFLNTMEASFVRAMFQNDARYTNHTPRLDRYLPDTSDSTLDLKPHRTSKKHSPSGNLSFLPSCTLRCAPAVVRTTVERAKLLTISYA